MIINSLPELISVLWKDYTALNPSVLSVYDLFAKKGETVINDHVAFRTLDYSEMNLNVLAKTFVRFGYEAKQEYHFAEKKLYAKHFEHIDPSYPKIFISELLTEKMPFSVQAILEKMRAQVAKDFLKRDDLATAGRPWQVSIEDYQLLKEHSEYAAWLSAYGFRVNHFTVLVNALKTFANISEVNQALKLAGHQLNTSGGEIKGTAKEFLEQSSTIAYNAKVIFANGELTIPACYYEFAFRYPLANGKLYSGFVAKSADKIFESTDRGQ